MIYLTGDTHREQDIFKINPDDAFPIGKTLTSHDYVIICGDFGCIWDGDKGDKFWLDWLESLPWQTCFIDGNHENFDLLEKYPTQIWHHGQVHRIRSNIFHLRRGEIYEIDGYRFFCFGGGASHDVAYRVSSINWWQQELPTMAEMKNARYNLEQVDWKVDYVLTHDVFRGHKFADKYDVDMSVYDSGYYDVQEFLKEIEKKLDYKVWMHGHYHVDEIHKTLSDKPCIALFNRVIIIEEIENL